ncbi:MAG: hypothetical protein ABI591_25130 [Kofleriaceae bacterium]
MPAIAAAQLARIPREVGRILYPRQQHLGSLAVLDEIEAATRDGELRRRTARDRGVSRRCRSDVRARSRAPCVIEGNAFGDLLPNLERDGLDVYGWQIHRLLGTVPG